MPYLVLTKRFRNLKLCQNKPLFGVKTTFKRKSGVLRRFSSLNFLSSKLLGSFKCFEKPTPISKCFAKMLQTLCLCPLIFLRKALSFQIAFSKKGDLRKPNFKASSKCFAK